MQYTAEITQYIPILVFRLGEHGAQHMMASINMHALFDFRVWYSNNGRIAECHFESVEYMLAFSVPTQGSAHDLPHTSRLLPNILLSLLRGANCVQQHCNVSIVFNEFCIVTGEAQNASDVLSVFRLRPLHYLTHLMALGVDAVIVNVNAATIDFLTSPGAFCLFRFETWFCQ